MKHLNSVKKIQVYKVVDETKSFDIKMNDAHVKMSPIVNVELRNKNKYIANAHRSSNATKLEESKANLSTLQNRAT